MRLFENDQVGVEVAPGIDSAEQVSNASQNVQNINTSNSLMLADSTGVEAYVDQGLAIDPNGNGDITFESGNWLNLNQLANPITLKIATVQKTIIPIIEVSLIELLGNNSLYKGKNFNAALDFKNGNFFMNVECVYSVEQFIGSDVDKKAIMHDAKYILDRVSQAVKGITWNKCEINCSQGIVTINFDY